MTTHAGKAVREHIAFGPKESFVFPVPAGFVPNREPVGVGEIKRSKPIRIDHSLPFGRSFFVIFVDDLGAANYDIGYEPLIYSDGIDGSNGEYKNAIWGPLVTLAAAFAGTTGVHILPSAPGAIPVTPVMQALRVYFKNNGAAATPAPVSTALPLGRGLHVRVAVESQP